VKNDELKRINTYLDEAKIHIKRLKKVLNSIPYPFKEEYLNDDLMDKLDVLAFRFSKLQSLIGEKLFREYLSLFYEIEGKSFFEILKLIEKEGIVDIDKWSEFRKVRNFISHDYPLIDEEKIEAINFLIENVFDLFEIVDKMENRLNETRKL